MNKLSVPRRAKILNLLVEGMSMRAITRIENVGINTIARLIRDAGEACAAYHDEHVRGIPGYRRIECDEVWSFVYAKKKNVPGAIAAPNHAGDAWTFTALDADSKMVVSYLVGTRSGQSAIALMDDLRSRLDDRPLLSTDGLKAYREGVEGAFGGDVDFVQIIKRYENDPDKKGERRYSPARCSSVYKKRREGQPDLGSAGTSHVERHNLTIRMGNRRFTRLTNAFSKNLDKHMAMCDLFFLHYNYCRIHKTLGVTPAMEAGLSDTLRDMSWIVSLIDARAAKPKRPKTYKKRH